MPKFEIGDRVAWSHPMATQHAKGSVLHLSALQGSVTGSVVDFGNKEKTLFIIEVDEPFLKHPDVKEAFETHPDKKCLCLTQDELVKFTEESQEPAVEDKPGRIAELEAELERLKGGAK